ncbi:hypothetical protein CkaCkLH20_05437 [Colletotrichum karsti]|uniref:Poly [ADP-ribose] polymerase n=1 Tax=Colletotrichum karsti TaxID=1095194 RepID=A0A9P6LLG1_9PEZI|nr:uncharacterized protein CkaCkLH20_05437 [Colletotrichum karsti]KAF9877171.1 hypothetical protein CkaCkLH20_05437 [Colletotrichum karsti]
MPPRRSGRAAAAAAATPAAPAPKAQPLDGAVVAISGTFDQKRAELESFLTSLGATNAKSITKKTTHLITTQEDFDAKTTKVASAQKNNIHIVSLEWAQECESKGSKVPEDDYAIGSGSQSKMSQPPPPAAVAAAANAPAAPAKAGAGAAAASQNASQTQPAATKANGSRKRTKAAAQSDNESDAPPEPKKKKAAAAATIGKGKRAAAAAAAASPDDDDDKTVVKKEEDAPVKKPSSDGQVAKSKNLVIPLDEGCKVQGTVYIAPDGVIYDASLNQTNASNNNNKFYRIQLIQMGSFFKTWTRWGRVGDSGQNAVLGNGSLDDALKQFDKKFKDKSGYSWADRGKDPKPSKYAFVERSYEPDSEDDDDADDVVKADEEAPEKKKAEAKKCTLPKPVEELMGLIFNMGYFASAMSSMDYDANKLPLGKLSKGTILRGFQTLKNLSELLGDPSLADTKYSTTFAAAIEQLSNQFYSLIPHAFGRRRPPIISTNDMLKKELDLLDSLSDMKVASDLMKVDRKLSDVHPADTQYRTLGMNEMTPLEHKSTEFDLLSRYLTGSKGSTHHVNYKVQQIFRIERNGELERFQKNKMPKVKSDRRLLWHGSRVTNFGGILSQGLRIAPPEAPVTGYMFGKGIYLADMSSKSANYCNSHSSGGEALLLLCEAELGDPIQKLTNASYNAGDSAKAGGMLSTWGQGRTGPSKWMDASCVDPSLQGIQMPDTTVTPGDTGIQSAGLFYNEFIVYDVAQVRLRYLFRVKIVEDEEFLRKEVEDGCPFCTLLYEAKWKLYGGYLLAGSKLNWWSFPRIIEQVRDDVGNAIHFCISDEEMRQRLRPFRNLQLGTGEPTTPKVIPRNTSSQETLNTINQWLHECTSSHPLCGEDVEVPLPKRVISIGPSDSEVRLLETNGAEGKYACLSHPWGKKPLVRTLKDNFSKFTTGIQLSSLPPTFRDAIDFTRRLGLQYIWIDSLCIIQDDPLDWQIEAAQMAAIYTNAHVTLAASKASDSSRGLYTSPLDPPHHARQLSLVNDVNDADVRLHACSELVHVGDFKKFFPITTRAWVYQERLLSARVVHFAGSEVNWECRSALTCECGGISAAVVPEKIQFAGSLADLKGKFKAVEKSQGSEADGRGSATPDYTRFSTALLQTPNWTESIKTWRHMVQQYCKLDLTFRKDTFPALAGVAKVWNPDYKGQYLAGLWLETLHLDLLWLVYLPERRAETWRAPTWSWASVDYHKPDQLIRFDSDSDTLNTGKGSWFTQGRTGSEDYAGVAEVLEAVCVPAGVDPCGELSSAHLLLSTYAMPGVLIRWPGVLKNWGSSPIWLVVGDLWVPQGGQHDRGFQPDAPINDDNSAWAMPVAVIRVTDFGLKTGRCPEMACLVIRLKEVQETPGEIEYERLGYVRFVEHGFSPSPLAGVECPDTTSSVKDFLTMYQQTTQTMGNMRSSMGKSELEWLKTLFELRGRQEVKLV